MQKKSPENESRTRHESGLRGRTAGADERLALIRSWPGRWSAAAVAASLTLPLALGARGWEHVLDKLEHAIGEATDWRHRPS